MNNRFYKKMLPMILSAAMIAGMTVQPLYAENGGKETASVMEIGDVVVNAISADFVPDKTTYEDGENVTATLKLTNNTEYPVKITVENVVPNGYELSNTTGSITNLKVGESGTMSFEYKDTKIKEEEEKTYAAKQKIDVSKEFAGLNVSGYTTSNKKVAAVSKKGIVKVKKTGSVEIGAFKKEGKNKVQLDKKIKMNVEKPVPVKKKELKAGESMNAVSLFTGITKAVPDKWESSKEAVVKLVKNEDGTYSVLGVASGSAKITAYFGTDKNAAKYKVKIKVPKGASSGTSSGKSGAKAKSASVEVLDSFEVSEINEEDASLFAGVPVITTGAKAVVNAAGVKETFQVRVKYSYDIVLGTGTPSVNFAEDHGITGLAGLTADRRSVSINNGADQTVRFTAFLDEARFAENPVVTLRDENGNVLDDMYDDGTRGGDETEGDGIYTCDYTFNENSRGENTYYAQYNDDEEHRVSENIAFYEPIPKQDYFDLNDALNTISENGYTTVDEVQNYVEYGNSNLNLESSLVDAKGNGYVMFTTTNGLSCTWNTPVEAVTDGKSERSKGAGTETAAGSETAEISEIPEISETPAASGSQEIKPVFDEGEPEILGRKKTSGVLVLRPYHGTDFQYDNASDEGMRIKDYKGCDITIYDDYDADLSAFSSLGAYEMVIIDSHGSLGGVQDINNNNQPAIITGEMFDPEKDYDKYNIETSLGQIGFDSQTIEEKDENGNVISSNKVNRMSLSHRWFQDKYRGGGLEECMLFLGSCYSAYQGKINNMMSSYGWSYGVYGFDNPVSVTYCNNTLHSVTDALLKGMTAGDAYEYAKKINNGGTDNIIKDYDTHFKFSGLMQCLTGFVTEETEEGNVPVKNACVTVTKKVNTNQEQVVKKVQVNKNGTFLLFLDPGEYNLYVSAPGYVTYKQQKVEIDTASVTDLKEIVLVKEDDEDPAVISGFVLDATTGDGVGGALVRLRKYKESISDNYIKLTTGENLMAISDDDGYYELNDLAPGYYTLEVSSPGYTTGHFSTAASAGDVTKEDLVISGFTGEGVIRVILTWGKDPRDLDSHMVGPKPGGGSFHTWFSDKSTSNDKGIIADLDLDDTTSYGPETTSVRQPAEGIYYFYVHHYAGEGSIADSGAKVKVYIGGKPRGTFEAPSGSGKYWNVFKYNSKTGELTERGYNSGAAATGETGIPEEDTEGDKGDDGEESTSETSSVFDFSEDIIPVKDDAYILKTIEDEKERDLLLSISRTVGTW